MIDVRLSPHDLIDRRLAFLNCAAARAYMVEHGMMELDQAFDGLVDIFADIICADTAVAAPHLVEHEEAACL
jgi:hypothetical protein